MVTIINQHNDVQKAVADAFNPFDGLRILLSKNVNNLGDFNNRQVKNSTALVVIHFIFEEEYEQEVEFHAKRLARKWLQAMSGGRFIFNRFLAISVAEEFCDEETSCLRILAEVESTDRSEFNMYDFAMHSFVATDFQGNLSGLGPKTEVCFDDEIYISAEKVSDYFKAYPIFYALPAPVKVLDKYAVTNSQTESLIIEALKICAED